MRAHLLQLATSGGKFADVSRRFFLQHRTLVLSPLRLELAVELVYLASFIVFVDTVMIFDLGSVSCSRVGVQKTKCNTLAVGTLSACLLVNLLHISRSGGAVAGPLV